MPKVMFMISYSIRPETRDEYLRLASELKSLYAAQGKAKYSLYEAKGKKGHFTEIFETESLEEFDALEDNHDERTELLVQQLQEFVDKGGMKYSTLVEAQ
jgi:hypothetical protein